MATKNTTADFSDFLAALAEFVTTYAEENGIAVASDNGTKESPRAKAAAAKKTAPAEEPEDDDQAERREELEAMTLVALRKLAIGMGFPKADVQEADKETLVDSILTDEAEGGDGESDEDDGSDDDEGYSREDLEAMGLRELQRTAKEDYGWKPVDYKGMDKDTLIDALLGASEDDDEENDEDEGDEDEGYTKEDLDNMSLAELKSGPVKEYGIKVRPGMKQAAIVQAILDAQDEGDDEDEEEDEPEEAPAPARRTAKKAAATPAKKAPVRRSRG